MNAKVFIVEVQCPSRHRGWRAEEMFGARDEAECAARVKTYWEGRSW